MCQTNKQTDRDKWTDARNRIWCILSLKCDMWWQYFNDFPDNQLTKFSIFIGWSQTIYRPPYISMKCSTSSTHRMDAPDRHNEQTDVSLCSFVFVFVCSRLGVWHYFNQKFKCMTVYRGFSIHPFLQLCFPLEVMRHLKFPAWALYCAMVRMGWLMVYWKLRSCYPQILLAHTLDRLWLRNECHFVGYLLSPDECRVADY